MVELSYRAPAAPGPSASTAPGSTTRSVYVGWTGLPSRQKIAPLVSRDGINGARGPREQEVALVEIDSAFAGTLGLSDGQKVTATIHLDPPLAHTVHIEPLTPADWELIESHATFLELHLMSQVRAVPNPAYASGAGAPPEPHPLTLHVTPTSSANIKVVKLEPVLPSDAPFAKIAPDAEVVVAEKTRPRQAKSSRENRSVASKSGRSAGSTVRGKGSREERKPALYLRAVDRRLCDEWFDDDSESHGLSIWIDADLVNSKELKGVKWAAVHLMRPASLQPPLDPQKQPTGDVSGPEAVTKIIAQIRAWDEPPNGQVAALSPPLCAALGCHGLAGGVTKIEPAPPQWKPRSEASEQSSNPKLKVYPFLATGAKSATGLRFGGESKAEREEAVKRIKYIYGGHGGTSLLQGPLTDGMVLGLHGGIEQPSGWAGGLLKFDPPPKAGPGPKESPIWMLGSELKLPLDVQPAIPQPAWLTDHEAHDVPPLNGNLLVGIEALLAELRGHLSHLSSVLLTGTMGSGKTSVAQHVANGLKREQFFHTTYFPCRKLVNDESRVSTIKETMNRVFMAASWGARLGGKALVILDDLDRLCPVETELVVRSEEGRSRQVSETLCSIIRQYCGRDSNVVVLATSQGKDDLHNVIIGGHIVREIVHLHAPDKETRRRILENMTRQNSVPARDHGNGPTSEGSRPTTADGSATSEDGGWMEGANHGRPESPVGADGFTLQDDLDFLDIAGEIDGYMPGDLGLLVSRARNEALMRSVTESAVDNDSSPVPLSRLDFTKALKGFTPASLRNVTLQHSTTTFASIGGLRETRRVLLETLEYPTKYAPIFAQCPLRLRSGLLLYGYPGCGKTLLASAVAGECGLNFISVKGPEILNKYIGASEKSVRDLFERAQAARPCVLFFDEFDSIAPKRGHDSTGVTDRVVNQLLTQMDGAEGLQGVYVLAATSRPDLIDPALLRPGRLDKALLCDFPGMEDRLDIIRALTTKIKLSDEVLEVEDDLLELARQTDGFSGADLQALVSNAQLEAIHDVLNQGEPTAGSGPGSRRGGGPQKKIGGGSAARSFLQFRYGADDGADEAEGKAKSRSAELAENAAIAAKLEGIKLARRRERALKGGGAGRTGGPGADKHGAAATGEAVVGWKHIAKALEGTRASISAEERRRLERIYREFVVGRSGEMRDGQGSMEIGGRSSLM